MEAFHSQTLCDLLLDVALNLPENGLTFLQSGIEDFISYGDLLQQAQVNGNNLRDAGIIENGTVVIVYFDNHKSNVIWTWSVMAAGGIPAILPPFSNDPKTHDGQVQNLRTLFGRPKIITTQPLMVSLSGLTDASIYDVNVEPHARKITAIDGNFGHGAHTSESVAALLFTSGSTGHSKAVEFSHRQLITSVRAKQQVHNLDSSTSFMAWISLDHSANFCELHLNAMNVGSNQYFVPASDLVKGPDKFFDMLARYKIGYTFSPNSFLAAACKEWKKRQSGNRDSDFSSAKVIMVGGEANKVATLQQADAILRAGGSDSHVVKAAYGLSETCSACFYNLQTPSWDVEQGNVFATVGKHLPIGLDLRIVNEESKVVLPGEEGAIQLRGDVVLRRYFNNTAATAGCMTADGWFDTGDIGRLDTRGHLAIVGRSKEIMVLGGNNYSSFELENAIECRNIPGVLPSWTATFSVWDDEKSTESVVVLFSSTDLEPVHASLRSINDAVVVFCSSTPVDIIPLPKEEMPKSTIGKLSRQKLKQSYLEGRFDIYRVNKLEACSVGLRAALTTDMQLTVARLLVHQVSVPMEQLYADSELAHLGMNSLDYLRLKRSFEVAIDSVDDPIPMPYFLQASTIGDLAALAEDRHTAQYQPLVTLRAEGAKLPLFLFPPGGGESMIWLPILKHLPDRPVYALRAKGIEKMSEGTFEGLEDMLDAYEAAILAVCPTGPYALLGLCFGGMTAFEIGKRLECRGHTLAFCGGLDNPPDLQHALRVGRDTMKDFIVDLLAYHKLIPLADVSTLEDRYSNITEEEAVQAIASDFRDRGLLDAGLTAEKLEAWYRAMRLAYQISRPYEPSGTVRSYDVIWANPSPSLKIDLQGWEEMVKRWEPYARVGCEYRWVDGDHFSLLEEENVAGLASVLREVMERREQELTETDESLRARDEKQAVAKDSGVWVRGEDS